MMKKAASSLKIELASYQEMLSFAQFGSDLDASTKRILAHGAALMETLKQKQYAPYPDYMQVLELYAVKMRKFDALPRHEIGATLKAMDEFVLSKHKAVLDELSEKKDLTPEIEERLKEAIEDFFASR